MPIPQRLDGLLAKIEATYGTDSVPVAGTDGVRITGPRLWPTIRVANEWENLRDDTATGTIFGARAAPPRGRAVTLEIPWEIKGPGVAYSASVKPEASPLLRASGHVEAGSFGAGVEKYDYTPANQLHESATIYAYGGGHLFKVVGCRGILRWPFQAGQSGIMRFAIRGLLTADPTPVAVPAITYQATDPLASVAMGLTLGSWVPDAVAAEFNQGGTVERLDGVNAVDGIREFDWADIDPFFTLSAKVPRDAGGLWDSATFNPWADAKARTNRALAFTQGSAQYQRAKLVNTNAFISVPPPADQNGFAAWDLTARLLDYIIRFD